MMLLFLESLWRDRAQAVRLTRIKIEIKVTYYSFYASEHQGSTIIFMVLMEFGKRVVALCNYRLE